MTQIFAPILRSILCTGLMALGVLFAAGGALRAEESKPLARLLDALLFDDITQVLAQEGRSLADDFAEGGFGVPEFAWEDMLSKLYDEEKMLTALTGELQKTLEGRDVAMMAAFFESDLGQKIASQELDARIALAEEEAQDAASDAWAALDPDTRRAQLIEDYVTANDLVEMNVVGAMNSDLYYYKGMWQAMGPAAESMSEADLLREIWAAEDAVRADVAEWVYGFSLLAYDKLTDDELDAYVGFAKSAAGQELNLALFAAFDTVYAELSRGLGAGAGALMQRYGGDTL